MNRALSAGRGASKSVAAPAVRAPIATRSVHLSAPVAAQLIRDAIGGGGEVWVRGSGQSMYPTIRHDEPVLLSPLRRRVRRGDVVLVPLGTGLMLHRAVHIEASTITTRGDARVADDRPVAAAEVLARAVAVRHGHRVSALVPTARFGLGALLRFAAESCRRHIRVARRMWRMRRRPA